MQLVNEVGRVESCKGFFIAMAEGKKTFIFYSDWINMIREMPDKDAGELLKHILAYVNDENPITENLFVKMAFGHMKPLIKQDLKKWESIKEKRKKAGAKGGKQTQANAKQVLDDAKQVQAVNVNVNVNDNVNDNDSEINSRPRIEKKENWPFYTDKFYKALQLWADSYLEKHKQVLGDSELEGKVMHLHGLSGGDETKAIDLILFNIGNKTFYQKNEQHKKAGKSTGVKESSQEDFERTMEKLYGSKN